MAYGGGYAGGYEDAGTLLVAVEVDFTLTDTWVDIAPYLTEATVDRGRQRELDRYQAGRATFTLRNETRLFDPTYTAGAYYGNVKPMRPIRCNATYGPTTYPLFRGFVDRWTQQPEGPHTASTVVEATDAFKVLARSQLPSSGYAAEVLADGPVSWWRLGEPAGTTLLHDSVGIFDLTVAGTPTLGADGLVSREPDAAMEITGDAQGGFSTGAGRAFTAFTCELVFRSAATDDGSFYAEINDAGTVGFVLRADGSPDLLNAIVATTTGSTALTSSVTVDDDVTHHFVLTWDGATAKLYSDGVEVDSDTRGGAIPAAAASLTFLGGYTHGPNSADGVYGTYDEVAVYDHALSPARILAHYQAVATPWDGDTPEERIERVLDSIGFTGTTDLDPGESILQPAELGMTALEHLQKVAESEMGALYVEADGTLRFKGRAALVNLVPVATFTDAAGSDPAISIYQPEYGDDLIRNEVTVSRLDGVAQTSRDQDSIDEFLVNSYTLDGLYHDDDTLSRSIADLIVSDYAQPLNRLRALRIKPRSNPTVLFPDVLALELTDKVTIEVTPQRVGSEVSQDTIVEGIEHRLSPKEWETRLTLSPAGAGVFGVWDDTTSLWDQARWFI